jgi:hypothetical protein
LAGAPGVVCAGDCGVALEAVTAGGPGARRVQSGPVVPAWVDVLLRVLLFRGLMLLPVLAVAVAAGALLGRIRASRGSAPRRALLIGLVVVFGLPLGYGALMVGYQAGWLALCLWRTGGPCS